MQRQKKRAELLGDVVDSGLFENPDALYVTLLGHFTLVDPPNRALLCALFSSTSPWLIPKQITSSRPLFAQTFSLFRRVFPSVAPFVWSTTLGWMFGSNDLTHCFFLCGLG
jgi:hypothetical protein